MAHPITTVTLRVICSATLLAGVATQAVCQGNPCTNLLSLVIQETQITSATVVAQTGPLPAHCHVVAVTHAEPDSNVGVEVRLPDDWNGKMLFTTRQGFMGAFPPLFNPVVSDGLVRHYAVVTTNGGHSSPGILDASFGLNNEPAEVDFGYRGVHLAKDVGVTLIHAYYGNEPAHSYYEGCSSSGRYAIQAAEHYPGDFDGIIAGSPVIDMSGTMIDNNWIGQAMQANPLPTSKLGTVWKAVTSACDGNDGLVDGLIDDPRECHFDVSTLMCPGEDSPSCLTAGQIDTLQKIYGGAFTSTGDRLFPGFAFGGEIPDPVGGQGWDLYVTGTPALGVVLQDQYLKYLAFEIDDPTFDWHRFDFDTDPPLMEAMHEIVDPVQDDLTSFAEAGGKMIIYQGWGDISQSPYRTIQYYQGLRQHNGRRAIEDSARLFMAPGMYHCGGGVGPNTFDALTSLEQWVEEGRAPSSILAKQTSGPGAPRTRPLCPFPQHAKYEGSGSIDDAANFQCQGAPIGTNQIQP